MKGIITLFLMVLALCPLRGQELKDSTALDFINSLIARRARLDKFILPLELERSRRLGIAYKDADKKYLISNDIDKDTRDEIMKRKYTFTYSIDTLQNGYSLLKAIVPKLNLTKEYIFKDSLLVSRPYYYSLNWDTVSTQYFVFHLSSVSQFNRTAAAKLDSFVSHVAGLLNYNDTDLVRLKRNKIHYFLCKDENEIEEMTGFRARGLYYIPYDYIISTFTCHYHELLHLLINYKLKENNLYTLPFFQEGFAVAFGGRGGKEPEVILDIGQFLVQSGMQDYNTLLSRQGFYESDISVSYPVSGLYNKFLISQVGIENYLKLYTKYSAPENEINDLVIDSYDLPSFGLWQKFIASYEDSSIIISRNEKNDFRLIKEMPGNYSISENSRYYLFGIKDTLLLTPSSHETDYSSKLFGDIFPSLTFKSENYALIADSDEVSLYNFYSNNLVAKYVSAFTIGQKKVSRVNGLYVFLLSKSLFDEPIGSMTIKNR